jgi:hypothetical protein
MQVSMFQEVSTNDRHKNDNASDNSKQRLPPNILTLPLENVLHNDGSNILAHVGKFNGDFAFFGTICTSFDYTVTNDIKRWGSW